MSNAIHESVDSRVAAGANPPADVGNDGAVSTVGAVSAAPDELVARLAALRGEGIQLWVEGGQIRFRAPGGLAADTAAWLKAHKPQVIAWLQTHGFLSQASCEGRLAVHGLDRAPLSSEQMRLWLTERLGQIGPTYHIPFRVDFDGPLDVQALERVLRHLLIRHESLRTLIVGDGLDVYQQVRPLDDWRLPVLQIAPTDDAEAEMAPHLDALARRPFDLARDIPFRALLISHGPTRHCLALCLHHIVSDGWSMAVFMHELAQAYRADTGLAATPLTEPGPQYIDYTLWQRAQDILQADDSLQAYWKRTLDGAPATSTLPADRPRGHAGGVRGAELPFALDGATTKALRQLARSQGTTLFNLLLGASSLALYRWTGQQDLIIGTPVAGRPLPQMERMLGLFVNMLPLRVQVRPEESFDALLRDCARTTGEAFAHQGLSFERISRLAPGRGSASTPLFQMALALETIPQMPALGPALAMRVSRLPLPVSRFELTLFVQDDGEALGGYAEYDTDLFDSDTIGRWLSSLQTILRHVAHSQQMSIDDIPTMDVAQREQVLVEWNDTAHPFPHDVCLHRLIESQVDRAPTAVALRFGDDTMSYAELEQAANRLAHQLIALGVGPDRLVGVCLERSFDMLVALLATLKAGGAYVPLDPAYPDQRLQDMCADGRPVAILTWRRFASRFDAMDTSVLCMDALPDEVADRPVARPEVAVRPEHLVYVIYTSGSTGKPKGVANVHAAVVNRLDWMARQYRIDRHDRLLQKTPYSFDVSVWELFLGLCVGAELVIAEPELHKEPVRLAALIDARKVSVIHFVPSMLDVFLDLVDPDVVRGLRLVFCSGEALKPTTRDRFLARFSGELHNLYGPTEAAIDVSYHHCLVSDGPVVPIGRPISNARLYVLDNRLRPVPIGVTGELYIGGPVLARGYLNKPELTAASFVRDPFDTARDARMYKTGDRARWRADGTIEYLGRLDGQVKLRGQRLELGEIEAVLTSDERIVGATVFVGELAGEPQLIAACVPSAAYRPLVDGHLRHVLPNGMAVSCHNRQVAEYLYQEMFVDHVYLRHGIDLANARCVIDVGANVGMFTLRAAELAPQARVFAFEPIPPTFAMLRANCALYAPGAVPLPLGLGVGEQEVTFSHYPGLPLMSGRYADHVADLRTASTFVANVAREHGGSTHDEVVVVDDAAYLLEAQIEVETHACRIRALSDVIDEHAIDVIDLLKIDVERSEWDVLQGIRAEHWPRVRQLVVEVHDQDGRLQRTLDLLQGHGLHCVVEQEEALKDTDLYNIYARRDTSVATTSPVRSVKTHRPPVDEARLLETLARTLPAYMVPARLLVLDEMPLSPNGKADRRALAAIAQSRRSAGVSTGDAPRGPIELAVAKLWCELLDLDQIARDDVFFEIGGHSLLALRMLQRLGQQFGQTLQPRQLLAAPTVAGLAAQLEAGAVLQAADGACVLLRPGRDDASRAPLFLFAGAGGQLVSYAGLLATLHHDGPLFGLQRPEVAHDAPVSFRRVEDLAAYYLDEIRAHQPEGPYRLCGWSLGGLVAGEVARSLRAEGETVAYLGMIDTALADAERIDALRLSGQGWHGREVASVRDGLDPAQREVLRHALSTLSTLDADALLDPHAEHADRLLFADLWAWADYRPDEPLQPTHCYRASASIADSVGGGTLNLAIQSHDMKVHIVEGSHWSILTGDAVASLARQIDDDLHFSNEIA